MLCDTILDSIGKTPLVKLQRIGSHLDANLYVKCEFLNPSGSVKDRIARQMIEDAEAKGEIRPGDTLIEPTSGNAGIGIALVAAVKGYNVIVTMPEKMSKEKQVVLEALGATVIRTPTEARWNSPESHIGVAKRLLEDIPRAYMLDQYVNEANPLAHYLYTAEEIYADLDGQVDMVVIGAGTGGTLVGTARRLKEICSNVSIVGVDPIGSVLAGGNYVASYKVEGIGYDFIPDVLDRELVDIWIKTDDRDAFMTARDLIAKEGLLCGGSSGAAVFAGLIAASQLGKGQNCVIVLPDSVRNYMNKFLSNKWMVENSFMDAEPQKKHGLG